MISLHPHRRSIFAAYLGVVLILLLTPISRELPNPDITLLDKFIHFVLFGGVAWLGYWNRMSVAAVTLFAIALAGTLELIQGPLPYRSAELLDFVAGAAGGVAGIGLAVRRTVGRADGQAGGTPRPPG